MYILPPTPIGCKLTAYLHILSNPHKCTFHWTLHKPFAASATCYHPVLMLPLLPLKSAFFAEKCWGKHFVWMPLWTNKQNRKKSLCDLSFLYVFLPVYLPVSVPISVSDSLFLSVSLSICLSVLCVSVQSKTMRERIKLFTFFIHKLHILLLFLYGVFFFW